MGSAHARDAEEGGRVAAHMLGHHADDDRVLGGRDRRRSAARWGGSA